MENLLIYLLKSAGLLSLFYILYILLLKNDTSFTANRKFLIGGILASLVLPAIYFTKTVFINAPEVIYSDALLNSNLIETPIAETELNWWLLTGRVYLLISAFFVLQFFFRIYLLLKIINSNTFYKDSNYRIVETTQKSGPFSFFKYIFLNPNNIAEDELQIMLDHEKVHARQYHTADMLLANLITALLWFNPLSWLYKKIIEQNLEYIADRETVNTSDCKQHYQHVLVKVTTNQYQPALVNHFYQSFIKKRIVMLNKKSSNRSNISKMSLIFPLLLAFMLSFNVKTEAQVKEKTKVVVNNVQFIPEILKSVIITSATTKDQLKEVAREFKKLGVELQFKKLKFSKEGLLTRINIKYEIEKTGDSGSLIKDGDTAIDDIEISLFEDFNIEIRSLQTMKEKNDYVVVSDSNSVAIGSIARPKKRVWKTNLDDVTMERVMYTSSSKNNTKGTFSVGNKVRYYPTENDTINGKGTIMNVRTKNGNQIKWTDGDKDSIKHKYRIIVLDSSNTNTSNISKNIKVVSKGNNDKPLYIINGEIEMDESKATSINPDNVENVYVIKNASAIKKYGAKGRNGVVKINTKNNKLFRIKATTTDEELEDLKRRVAATTDFQLSLNSIERNKEGLISKINIKFSGNSGKMVSGNYSELDGIADIYVGQKEDGGVIIYSN